MVKQNRNFDLVDIDAISELTKKSISTLINWRRDYDFPMEKKGGDGPFVSSTAAIKKWYEDRGCNVMDLGLEAINNGKLDEYRDRQSGKKGHKFINRKLSGIDEIVKIVDRSAVTVLDWLRYFDCPIKKNDDGKLSVDADELYFWLQKTDFNKVVFKL